MQGSLRLSVRARCVFLNGRSYGPVRCGFKKKRKSYGAVRCCFDIVNPTVRFGAVIYPTVRLGAVLKNRNPTVRVGAVFRNQESYGAVRCGCQDIVRRFGAVPR